MTIRTATSQRNLQFTIGWFASPALKLRDAGLTVKRLTEFRIFSTPAPSNLHYLIVGSVGNDPDARLLFNECNSLALIVKLVRAKRTP